MKNSNSRDHNIEEEVFDLIMIIMMMMMMIVDQTSPAL